MPDIKSALNQENYNDGLKDIEEYEKFKSQLKLMSELLKGEQSGKEKGWLSLSDIEREFT